MTVLENLRLSQIALSKRWYVSWKDEVRAARETLASFDLDMEPWQRIDGLSAVDRALLVIVRAFEEIRVSRDGSDKPGLILLDEPTPFLPEEGVEKLFDLMRQIASSGSSVIFITHDIGEIMRATDRVTVLRDGCVSGETLTCDATRADMIEMIIGRQLEATESANNFRNENFSLFARIEGVSAAGLKVNELTLGEGEVVGLSGLIGSGYDRLLYSLFGATVTSSGCITFPDGRRLHLPDMTPADAISEDFALLPADRPGQSGVGSMRVFENMMLPGLDNYFSGGFLRSAKMRSDASEWGSKFEVRPNEPNLNLAALSGGNAQKVLIARWMKRHPRLILLDEPTQGVDVGTRAMIIEALREAASQGMTILCASSDPEQLANLCHRVLVFSKGMPSVELHGSEVTRERITQACYDSDTLLSSKTANIAEDIKQI